MNLLEMQHVKKGFGENEVLKDISLSVAEGEVVSIIGPSGSGKSTLLRCATLLEQMDDGSLTYMGEKAAESINGKTVYAKPADLKKIQRHFGLVFQNFNLFPHYSVLKNIIDAPVSVQKRKKEEVVAEAKVLLEKMGLSGREDAYPCQLSGGQRQRVGVARAFATDSDLILMDEPFSALDPLTREELQDEIVKLQKEYQKTIVFVTHDMDEAIKCADKICFIQNGTVIQFDKTEEILRHPANDYVEKFVGKNRLWGNPKYIHASDIMCKEPYTLSKDRTVIQALQVMRQNAINSIFITEGKSRGFLGIVWLEDLSKLDVQHMSASIGDMISSDYVSVYEESSLQEIIDEIDYYKSGIIPVLNERRELKGALTKSILLSTLSKRYKKEQEG